MRESLTIRKSFQVAELLGDKKNNGGPCPPQGNSWEPIQRSKRKFKNEKLRRQVNENYLFQRHVRGNHCKTQGTLQFLDPGPPLGIPEPNAKT